MANVKVAVRVRPLSKRESAEGGRVIVEVDDKVAKVRNIKEDSAPSCLLLTTAEKLGTEKMDSRLGSTWDSREKTVAFTFDYCYWSVDPEDPKYASQEMVFQDLGTSVLSGAFKGYNICLFAYGQTGSGKTYTMMGTPASIGLTPRICEGLFSRKDDYSDQTASCRVKVSFLEIYNERVRDLLKQCERKEPYTLRVREHPETGPYVQGLTHHLVTDYKQVVELLEEGIAKRITAATHIHNASSRSHAIFTIHYTQAILENDLPSEISSKINLVDLAGSERADPSYCKDRIAEGANINKSLVTLRIVISILAQNSQMCSSCQSINSLASEGESSPATGSVSGTRRPAYIPYRDSILTWLLKNSLGGNSKTIMIATISPASSSYNETMSTLRYASNAKNIINKPRVNEDANVKLIRELREEIDRLKAVLMSFELQRNSSPSWSNDRDGNLTELVLQNEMKIEQLTKDWTSKWTERKAIMEEYSVDINRENAGVTIDSGLPHLMAMDDDILSTGVVLYHLREGTTKIGRSDSDQDQDIVLQGRWIAREHCTIDNSNGIVTLRPARGAHCAVNGAPVTGACRLSQGALVVLGKSYKFRFNHPAEAAILRQRRSINESPQILCCRTLDWLNLDGSCTHSPRYSHSFLDNQKCRNCRENKCSPELRISNSRQTDAVHEEYKQKLRDQEAIHSKQIQQQCTEVLKQQLLRGQLEAEQELEHEQALINQQIQENQHWLINENKQLVALQQQQREFAVQTESTLCAEAEVQSTLGLEICPSLLQQNKRLVQLELLQRYSLKKSDRNIRQKKVKLQLERIVKKQKLLEAKQNLEQLEASCCCNEECVKQSQGLSENTAVQSSSDQQLPKRRKSLGSSSLQHSFCKLHLPQVPSCLLKRETVSKLSTSPNTAQFCEGSTTGRLSSVEYLYRGGEDGSESDDLNGEKGISFSVQRQLIKNQNPSSFGNKKGAEKNSDDSAVMAYINKNDPKLEKLDDNPGQAGSQKQTSQAFSPGIFKEKDEPETFIPGTRTAKAKVLRDISQPASSNLEQNRAQVSNRKIRMDISGEAHRSPENFPQEMKKTVYGNPPSVHLKQTAKNWKREPNSALPRDGKLAVEQKEFLMVATSVENLSKVNTQALLSRVERKWHSAEMLSAGVSKAATDVLGNWQEEDENEISDTDSSYSVDSLSCAYAKAFPDNPKQEDFDRNQCLANPEDSESDDSQMSQDSLIEKENKAKKQNKSPFPKCKAHREPAKLCRSGTVPHISSLVTHVSRRGLGKPERSFSLDSLADGEEMLAEDPVEESKSDSSDEVPAEIFWKLQTPRSPTIHTEDGHKSKTCNRETEGMNYDLKLSGSFYLDTKPQPASSTQCKQLLKGTKVSLAEQETSPDRRLYCTSGNPLLPIDAWSSCGSQLDGSSGRITAPSSHEDLQFQEAHLCSLSQPELWVKKDDLKQSAAEVSFVSGSKQIHTITHLARHINEINTVFASDTSEVPLPETTTASRVSESGSLNKNLKGWTNSNEKSSFESQDLMSSFVSSAGTSSSFVPVSAKHGYYKHSGANHPEQEQLEELATLKSATECTQTFSCLESASTADCLSLVSRKEKDSLPTTHPDLPEDHNLKKTPFIFVLPMQILEQRNSCADVDLEDDFFRTLEKRDLDADYSNLMTESSMTDSGSRSASVSAPAADSSTGLAFSMTSAQTSAVKQVRSGNHGQLFPRREIPRCCDEGFFLSDLTDSYKLQTLAGQGAESAVTVGLLRSGESNLKTMQETDYGQIPAEEVITETAFSSQKTVYRCKPLVVTHSASYDQSATPIEMSQKEIVCMETSRERLAEAEPEVPSFRDAEEYEPKDEDLSSLNHYEFKSKPVSKQHSHECAVAARQSGCLSQQSSENSTLCIDNIREESSESKEHNDLNSQAAAQKECSSKYENLVVNEASYLIVNVNGKGTKSFPAAVCERTNYFLPESNSNLFYKAPTKANVFQSASETENYAKLLKHVTIAKGDCNAASNLTVEASGAESCSDVGSGCLSTMCSSKSAGQKKSMHKVTSTSGETETTILLEKETQNKSSDEPGEEKEAFYESDCPEDILLVEDDVKAELGKVLEYNTNTPDSQEERPYIKEESTFLRNPETKPEETLVPCQNTRANIDGEITKLINSAHNLEKNTLAIRSRQIESLPGYSIAEVQSVNEERAGGDFKGIGLSQGPKKPVATVAGEAQCELYTNLWLAREEAQRAELKGESTGAEHTQESKELHSSSQLETSSFCQREKSEKLEIGSYSPEFAAAPKSIPSAVCSHTTDITQNASFFLDTSERLLEMNRTIENVLNREDIAATVLIRQGNILAKPEKEGQVNSSNLNEHCIPNCLPQEDKVEECEVTGSEEQIVLTNTEGLIITRQEVICTDEHTRQCCDREDEEEIFNQFKLPERYLTASALEENVLLEDDSGYHDPTEMNEDAVSLDSLTKNAVMKETDADEDSVDDSSDIEQYRIEQECKSLHMKEDKDTYMSCSVGYPEHGTAENWNVSTERKRPGICELDPAGSRVQEEKVHLMNLVQMAKTDKEMQMFVENTEGVEPVILQNLHKLYPENKDSCQITDDDNRLNETFRESQGLSSFSTNNESISKQQNPPPMLNSTEKTQEHSLKDSPCQSVNHLLCVGVRDYSHHLTEDVPSALKGHTEPSNNSIGTGAVLPYYETLMESEVCASVPVTVKEMGEHRSLSDKMLRKNVVFLQPRATQDRQEEESCVFNTTPDNAVSGQAVNENSSSSHSEGGPETNTVVLQQGAKGKPFCLKKLGSSEEITQHVNNTYEEHSVDLMFDKLSKDCLNSTEDSLQEDTGAVMPDSLLLDHSNLLSSSEKEAMEDTGGGEILSLLEASSQKAFHSISTTKKVLCSRSLSQHDGKEKFLSTSYTRTNSKDGNTKFSGVVGYQHEPGENQGHGASEKCCVDQPGSTASENASTLSEGLNNSPWENPHHSKDFLNYNRDFGASKCSPDLLNHPASPADVLIANNSDKGKNDAVLSEETKYFDSKPTDLSVTFPGVAQKGDVGEINSAPYTQNNKLPEKVVETEEKEKIIPDSFQNCSDINEDKIPRCSEHNRNTSSVTVPESDLLAFQSPEQTGSEETKPLPSCFAADTPTDTPFQSSKNFSAFDTCLLNDSKSLLFSQLEDSLQDTFLTEQVSSSSADVCSVEGFPQAFTSLSHPSLTPLSESSLTADKSYGEAGTCGTSHSSLLKPFPSAVLQIQDTQSDKAVVFDEPLRASGSILLSLAKENRHCPVSDTDSTSYKSSAGVGEPVFVTDCKEIDSDSKVDQHHWGEVSPQEACTKHKEKVLKDNSLLLPSLPFWDTAKAIFVKEGQMRKELMRNEEELLSNTEAERFAIKTEQKKSREPVEKQINVSSNSGNELIGLKDALLENLYPEAVAVNSEHRCSSFSPTYPSLSRSTDPRWLHHTLLGFERNPAGLKGNCQYVSTGEQTEQVPDRTSTDVRQQVLPFQNNTGSGTDRPEGHAETDNDSATRDAAMSNETLKLEGMEFSVMDNEITSMKILPERYGLPPRETKLVQLGSKRSYSTTRNTKSHKQSEHRPSLQSHRLSAPAIAVFSDIECTLEASSKADPLLYSASKSLQDLNMSVEPPSPTEDDLHAIERFSKQESKNFLQVKSNPRLQQRMAQTVKLASCDPQNTQNFAARTQNSQSLKDCTTQPPSSLPLTAHSSVGAETNEHSKSSSVAQCSEGKVEEAGYQPETDLFLQNNKDTMHFSSSDINPYILPWQRDGLCKIGWKQYVFGSASDVSCNQIPLNLENHKVMRCSSVDNGLNSQNSPFHSHLSSYAATKVLSSTLSSIEGLQGWDIRQDFQSASSSDSTKQYSNVSCEPLKANPQSNTGEFENLSVQPGNSSVQVDEIVLLYPSESETSSKKLPGTACEQGTQTAATGRFKRQRRHQRSYTDVSARKQEKPRDHQPSSWTSMQNLSMHLSQLLQNTSELLGNLSQQSIIDNKQNAKMNQRVTEAVKAARSDSCTQTTADVGIQTEILEEYQSNHEEKQVDSKPENELRAVQAVNTGWKGTGIATVGKIPKRNKETLSLEERTQEQTGMRNLGNPDFCDSLDSMLEDSFMCLPLLPRTSAPILDFKKASLNAQQNVAFASARVSSVALPSLSSGQNGSSCSVVSSPTSSTSQSLASCAQDNRSVNELEVPVERKFSYKSTLLVDRASSPILTLSASPSSQTAFSRSVCPGKEPLGPSSDAPSPLCNQRKLRASLHSSRQPHVDSFSQTETDTESSASREHKGIKRKSEGFSDKKAAKELLEQRGSKDLEQQRGLTVDARTPICAKELCHSSGVLEVSGHRDITAGEPRAQSPLACSLRCVSVTRAGKGSSTGIGHEKHVGNSDAALSHTYSAPKADLLLNKKHSAACSSKANAGTSSVSLLEASSLQFQELFWRNENSCPPLRSDGSEVQTSFQDTPGSVTDSECDTEIPFSQSTTCAKSHRPRSYSLRDLPIHNKFSNWCGVQGSPSPFSLSFSGSVTDIPGQVGKKPGSTRATEMEGKPQLWDSRSREIKKLQRERAQVMSGIHLDLHQHPLTVELAEAKLNQGIGQTDALLRVLQSGTADELVAIPVKQQLYERHMKTIETLRKEREKRLQRYKRSRSLSPQKHLSLLQTLDAGQRDLDLPSRRREYLQQLRRDVVENTRGQEPKRRNMQHPSDIELLLRDYQRAREEAKSEIARARDKLRERAEQEKRRIRQQMCSHLQREEARLKTLASTSTLCTGSSLSLSSGPSSGYNSSNTATCTASNLSSQEAQVSSGNALLVRDTRGRSAVRNSQLCVLEQLQRESASEASGIQPPLSSSSISCRFTHELTISISSSSTKGYQDLSKHILANATTEVMAACSHNLRNLYTCQAAAGWKYQCTEKEVMVYYKAFPSATRHGFLGAGVIERPLPSVWGLVRDPGKRCLYDRAINTARVHKKVTSHIQLVYFVTDASLCYLKQPRDFCCITVEAKEEKLSVLALQSVYDASMPHPCKEVVRGEILPSAWILEPDVVNGRDVTRVIYMLQVDLGAPAIPARLLSSMAKRQPLVIAHLAHLLTS